MKKDINVNKKNQSFKIIEEVDNKSKDKSYLIEFIATKNQLVYKQSQIKRGTAYDLKQLQLEKRLDKEKKLKERLKGIKKHKAQYDFKNFTKDKTILALDLATRKTGVTIAKDNSCASYLLEVKEDDFYKRLHIITEKLVKLIDKRAVEKVVLEDVWLGLNSNVLTKLITIRAFILRELIKRNIEFQIIPPQKWRGHYKSLKGLKREELKKESIRLYKNFTGKNTSCDDLAESYLIYKYSVEN